MTNTSKRYGLITLAWLLATGLAAGAAAMPTCEGTYAAQSLHPLPAKIVAGLDIHDPTPDHVRLAERFLSGMSGAGVSVGPKPSVRLSISSSRLETPPDRSEARMEPSEAEMSGLQGGFQLGLPMIPNARLATPSSPPPPPLLLFHVEVTDVQAARIAWVANVRCQMIGSDDGARAEELGRVLGGALGRRIDRQPF